VQITILQPCREQLQQLNSITMKTFEENQTFVKTPIFGLLILFYMGILFYQIFQYYQTESEELWWSITITSFVFSITTVLFILMKLSFKIEPSGVSFKYVPFINTYRKISFDEMVSIEVKRINPLIEFGGWGYRFNLFKKKTLLNIWGRYVVEIVLKSGKTWVIGTQQPDLATKILENIKNKP
jgi:hypothetical protein